jgi:hypothetical protein
MNVSIRDLEEAGWDLRLWNLIYTNKKNITKLKFLLYPYGESKQGL